MWQTALARQNINPKLVTNVER